MAGLTIGLDEVMRMRGWAMAALVATVGCSGTSAGIPDPMEMGREDAGAVMPAPSATTPSAAPDAGCVPLTCRDYPSACGGLSDGCGGHVECPCPTADAGTTPMQPPPDPTPTPAVDAGSPEPMEAEVPDVAPPPPVSDLGRQCGNSGEIPPYTCAAGEWCGGPNVYAMTCRKCMPQFAACGSFTQATGYGSGSMCCSGDCAGGGACN